MTISTFPGSSALFDFVASFADIAACIHYKALRRSVILPQELVDAIVDNLRFDFYALKSCSLVCQSFVVSARRHLFRRLRLTQLNADSQLKLLSTPSTLRVHVRHVEIHNSNKTSLDLVIPELVRCLSEAGANEPLVNSRVTYLSISGNGTLVPKASRLALDAFRSLVYLKLEDSAFGRFAHAQALICSFPSLEILHLVEKRSSLFLDLPSSAEKAASALPSRPMTSTVRLIPPARLKNVSLDCRKPRILDWFLSLSPVHLLTTLLLHNISIEELPSINRYVQATRETLTQISLKPRESHLITLESADQSSAVGFFRHIDLSRNDQLRHVELFILGWTSDFEDLPDVLRQLLSTNPRLEDITLSFEYALYYDPRVRPGDNVGVWVMLDKLLAEARRQRSLRLTLTPFFSYTHAMRLLPQCSWRDVLQVESFVERTH